jgi:4'-phosphopantetheinyl transferase EntD
MERNVYAKLTARMKARGHESPYLDRLEAHLSLEERHETLEVEIRREVASSLGRAGVKVDYAFLSLEEATAALDAATPDERAERQAAYEAARRAAERALLDLRITREAVGLNDHVSLQRMYPLPPRRIS